MSDAGARSSPLPGQAGAGSRQGTAQSGRSNDARDSPRLDFSSRGPVVELDDDDEAAQTVGRRQGTKASTTTKGAIEEPSMPTVSSPVSIDAQDTLRTAPSSQPTRPSAGSRDDVPPQFPDLEQPRRDERSRQQIPAFRIVGHQEFDDSPAMPEANPIYAPHSHFLRPPGTLSGLESNRSSAFSQTTEQAEEEAERMWKENEELYKAIQGRLGFSDSPSDSPTSSASPTPVLPVPGAFPGIFRFGAPGNESQSDPSFPQPHPTESSRAGTQRPFIGGFGGIPTSGRPSTDTFFTVPSESQDNASLQADSGTEGEDAQDQDDGEGMTQKFPIPLTQRSDGTPPSMPEGPSLDLVGALNVPTASSFAPGLPTPDTAMPEPSTHGPIPTIPKPQKQPSMPQASSSPDPYTYSPTIPTPQSTLSMPKPTSSTKPSPEIPKPQSSVATSDSSSFQASGSAPTMPKPHSSLSMPKPTASKPSPAMPKPPSGSAALESPAPVQPTPQVRPPRPQQVRPTVEPQASPIAQYQKPQTKPTQLAPGPSPSPLSVYSQDEEPKPAFYKPTSVSASSSGQSASSTKPPPQQQHQGWQNAPSGSSAGAFNNVGNGKPTATHQAFGGSPAQKPPVKPAALSPAPIKPSTSQSSNGHVASAAAAAGKYDNSKPMKPFNTPTSNYSNSNLHSSSSNLHSTKPPAPSSAISDTKPSKPSKPARPAGVEASHSGSSAPSTGSSPHTRYVNMLLALDDIPNYWNILASFFTWILLAGFLLFPGTFTSWREEQAAAVGAETGATDELKNVVLSVVSHVPLFVIAFVCSGIGAAGMIWLWWRWMANYIWLLNKVFVPGLMNALAGLISTLANIYGAQEGQISTTALTTLIVTATCSGLLLLFTLFYQFWLLRRVQNEHWRQIGKQKAGRHGEGVLKGMMDSKRKAKQGA